jgi:hypothetical protein
MKHPNARDLPDVAVALRESGLPDSPSTRWWATKILATDGFRRGLSYEATVRTIMDVIQLHPERSKDFLASAETVTKQTRAYVRSFFSYLPSEPALQEVVTTIAEHDVWASTLDICILVTQSCRLCAQAKGCLRHPDSFVVPIAVALVQRWLPGGSQAAASRLLGLAVRSGKFEMVREAVPGRLARTYAIHVALQAEHPFLGDAHDLAEVVPRSLGDLLRLDADGRPTRVLLGVATDTIQLPWDMGVAYPSRNAIHLDIENVAVRLRVDAGELTKRWCRSVSGFRGTEDGRAVFQPHASIWRTPAAWKRPQQPPLHTPAISVALSPTSEHEEPR